MADTEYESETTEIKKPVKEVTVVQDQGVFRHVTGDVYDGFFEAKKKDRSLRMQGPGTYTTAEGDTYSGTWENDRLGQNDEATISFVDTSRYEGFVKDWSYNGPGKFIYPDTSILSCNFVDNCPIANLELQDPNGHTWLAKAEQGFAWFEPMNHYYGMLENTKEGGRVRRRRRHDYDQPLVDELDPVELRPVKSTKSKLKNK